MSDFAPLRLCAFALFFSSACAQAPDAEIALAVSRVETARSADAAVFAAEPLHRAETALATARSLTSEKDYLPAIHAAGDAVTLADGAFEEATIAKRVAMRDLDRCLSELEGLIDIARSRGAPLDELAAYGARYQAVRSTAHGGDVLEALDQAVRLKPELLAFEQRFRN